jgi:hypothetical protein
MSIELVVLIWNKDTIDPYTKVCCRGESTLQWTFIDVMVLILSW